MANMHQLLSSLGRPRASESHVGWASKALLCSALLYTGPDPSTLHIFDQTSSACFAPSLSIVLTARACSACGNDSRLATTRPRTLICTASQSQARRRLKVSHPLPDLAITSSSSSACPGPFCCNHLSRPQDHLITCDDCLLIALRDQQIIARPHF